MKREITKQVRWTKDEVETVEKVLEKYQTFSDFVRDAALAKAESMLPDEVQD